MKLRRLCIFAHYDKDNIIDPYVVYYIKSLSKICDIIFVSDCNLAQDELCKLNGLVIKSIAKHHGEYDFGSYKRGYIFAEKEKMLPKYEWLFLVNDSCYGPFFNINRFIKEKERLPNTIYGMTINTKTPIIHIQSYFLVMPQKAFLNQEIKNFFHTIKKRKEKHTIAVKYEFGLSKILLYDLNFHASSFFNDPDFKYNPQSSQYLAMIKKGFPFLKKSLFDKNANKTSNLYMYKKLTHYISPHLFSLIINNLNRTIAKKTFQNNTNRFYLIHQRHKTVRYLFSHPKVIRMKLCTIRYYLLHSKKILQRHYPGFALVKQKIHSSVCETSAEKTRTFFKSKLGKIKWVIFHYHEFEYKYLYNKRFKNNLSEFQIKKLIKHQFENNLNYKLNPISPQTFNEKIQWLKLYYHNPLITICSDKYLMRGYIQSIIGKDFTVPIIQTWEDPKKINFSKLPKQFVLKVNWGSGQNIIVTDKAKLNFDDVRSQLESWLKPQSNHYYNFFEWGYKNIHPKIICEKYILENSHRVYDYKFFCFNGQPKIFYIAIDSYDYKKMSINYYDINFNLLPLKRHYPNIKQKISIPKHYHQMLQIAADLSKPFPFCRVDFFDTDKKLYVGELTFYPGAGVDAFTPLIWDYKIGKMLTLPKKMYER